MSEVLEFVLCCAGTTFEVLGFDLRCAETTF